MPTGYTAGVKDGTVTDFRTFALTCARAFGATIMQREEPTSAPPKLQEPSDYYAKSLASAEARVVALRDMSEAEAWKCAEADHARAMESYGQQLAERQRDAERYNAMLAKVDAWTPPTPDHAELRKFMRDQLVESIRFDCSYTPTAPIASTGSQWLADARLAAARAVERARKSHAEEVERTNGRNGWIRALYDSLEVPNAE